MQPQAFSIKKNAYPGLLSQDRDLIDAEKILYTFCRSVVDLYARAMLRTDIQWSTPLPDGPKILAANHPTTLDPIYLLRIFPEPVSILVTAAAFDIPILGQGLRICGHIPAVRSSGGTTVDITARKVKSGRSVAIFPEGALSPLAGGFHRPHSGVARVALRTGAPVIPIGIGVQRDQIRVSRATVDDDEAVGHFYLRGPYAITVGRPLYFRGDARDHERVRDTADYVMDHIRKLAHESDARIRARRALKAGLQSAPDLPIVAS